jgi:hypothetical protein
MIAANGQLLLESIILSQRIECTHAGPRATAFTHGLNRHWVARFVSHVSRDVLALLLWLKVQVGRQEVV